MNSQEVNYDNIMEEQANLVKKRGQEKRKSLISKDVQYFDSTELPKLLNQRKESENEEKPQKMSDKADN